MTSSGSNDQQTARTPFPAGTVVLVMLGSPREKFWGALLELTTAGLSVRGIDLNSYDDFVSLVRVGEAAMPAEVFFPMHRIERIEVDMRNGDIPSLAERFESATKISAAAMFGNESRSVSTR